MNKENIIFLGIINNSEEFYKIFNFSQQEFNEETAIYNDKKIIITEEEIKQYFGNYKDIKELREIAIKYFADNIQGKTFDIGKFKNIRINKKAKYKYKTFSADERKLLIVPNLLEILKTSKYKKSSPKYKERKDKITIFHYFTNEITLKNEYYEVYITIGEDDKGNLFWDLDENKKPSETLHQTNDVFSEGNDSII